LRTCNKETEIYQNGTPDVELEALFFVNRYCTLWTNVNYIWKEGSSEALHQPTELKMGTISLGYKTMALYSARARVYLGLGLSAAYLHTVDHSAYLPGVTTRWGGGLGWVF
jgi:hypothetical protein